MAVNVGTATFTSGTGSQTINFGITGILWADIDYTSSSTKPARGFIYGGNQYTISDSAASPISGKALQIKDNSGTVVFEITYTSTSGTNITFNKTVNTLGTPSILFRVGNE